jgi:hypothetical protein
VSARRALRHLDFGLRDRPGARQSVAECFEPVWSGKDACRSFEALRAASYAVGAVGGREGNGASGVEPTAPVLPLHRPDWIRPGRADRSGVASILAERRGANGSGRCGLMIPATSCRRRCTLWRVSSSGGRSVGILQRPPIMVDTAGSVKTAGNVTPRSPSLLRCCLLTTVSSPSSSCSRRAGQEAAEPGGERRVTHR